jgi:hypothetical protein
MKILYTIILLSYTMLGISQNFNGSYTSMQTSFSDIKDSKNNFKENTLFNITIVYDSAKIENSYVLIQDPRIPKKVLTYKIRKKYIKIPSDEYTITSYIFKDCINTNTNSVTDLVIYYNKQNELNLMVADNNSSQAFKKLMKLKKTTVNYK